MTLRYALLTATILSLSACDVGRDYTAPDLPSIGASALQETNQGRFKAAEPVTAWWNSLNDRQLSELVNKAVSDMLPLLLKWRAPISSCAGRSFACRLPRKMPIIRKKHLS